MKSISLATFSENEVAGVKAGGNEVNNELYMARFVQRERSGCSSTISFLKCCIGFSIWFAKEAVLGWADWVDP